MSGIDRPLGQGFDERVPVVLVLDTSESMARPPQAPRIAELNSALSEWLNDARGRPGLRSRVEVAIITFGSDVRVLDLTAGTSGDPGAASAFVLIGEVTMPRLRTGGVTMMLPAVSAALDLALARRRLLTDQGVLSRRPLIWLLTDGAASDADGNRLAPDDLAGTAGLLRAAEQPSRPDDGCLFYAIGVGEADRAMLEVLAPASTLMLGSVRFRDILDVVFRSSDTVRSSDQPGEAYRLAGEHAALAEGLRSLEESFLDQ